ncbi:MAG: flagellar motor switch protein FliM [Chloroflexota bacterium]
MEGGALSQAEIDALLSNLGKQEANDEPEPQGNTAKSVKPYDFRRPDKFSKDQVRALQMLHETFARLMSSSLSARLRTMVQSKLASIDQGVYNEYLRQVSGSTILGIIGMDPLPGNILLETSPDIAYAMIDRLLGGPGRSARRLNTITDIELALLKSIFTTMIQDLQDTWNNIVQLTPQLKDIILNPRFIQVAFQGDAVIILVFEIKMGDVMGTITICIPYTVLEPIIPVLNAQSWFALSRKNRLNDSVTTIQREVYKMHVPVSVILGTTDVDFEELLAVQPGDVIRLDSRVGQELEVAVAGKVKYLGLPGRVGNRLATRITRVSFDNDIASAGEQVSQGSELACR